MYTKPWCVDRIEVMCLNFHLHCFIDVSYFTLTRWNDINFTWIKPNGPINFLTHIAHCILNYIIMPPSKMSWDVLFSMFSKKRSHKLWKTSTTFLSFPYFSANSELNWKWCCLGYSPSAIILNYHYQQVFVHMKKGLKKFI